MVAVPPQAPLPPLPFGPTTVPPRLPRFGRATLEDPNRTWLAFQTMVPPTDVEARWRTFNLESQSLEKLSAFELIELLRDLSPEMSKALFDWMRFCNPGYEYEVTDLAGQPFPEGQAMVDDFILLLTGLYGSPDVPIGKLFHGAWLRGAIFCELVLDESGTIVDFGTPDPLTARFKPVMDPVRGQIWEMGQIQLGVFVSMADRPTVRYVAVDPAPGSAYGRSIAAAGLFACLFIFGILKDLRRVVQQQGYEHMDLKVLGEVLIQQMPVDVQGSAQQQKAWVDKALQDIADYYGKLEPDDAFVHTDAVEVANTRGAVNADSIGGMSGILEALERMGIRALKSMPMLMGITDGVSEANANRQYEMYLAGVKAIQHLAEHVLGNLLGFGLRARGLQGRVTWRFAEIRGAEELRDEQIKQLRSANALFDYLSGFITHDQASITATGSPEAAPAPILVPKMYVPMGTAAGPDQQDGEPGAGVPVAKMERSDAELEQIGRRFVEFVGSAGATSTEGVTPTVRPQVGSTNGHREG